MDELTLQQVSEVHANRPLLDLVDELENAFPDKFPRKLLTEYETGYMAGALEVIRRIKSRV